jgi:hypothetical protein
MIASNAPHDPYRETEAMPAPQTLPRRALTGLAIGAIGALGVVAAAGLYAETIRVPDQP